MEVEEYIGNVFMVKFYLKAHSLSPNKYHFLTNYGAAQTVIFTVIAIMLAVFKEREVEYPSFAFMGSNTKFCDERADELKANTKRFRSYKRIISIFFGSQTFEFIKDETASILIIKNRGAKIDEQMSIILQHIYNNYEILEINLMSDDGKA